MHCSPPAVFARFGQHRSFKRRSPLFWGAGVVWPLLASYAQAVSYDMDLLPGSVASGYNNCKGSSSWLTGNSSFEVTIAFKQGSALGDNVFAKRGVAIYMYDKQGQPTMQVPQSTFVMSIDGANVGSGMYSGRNYYAYVQTSPPKNDKPVTMTVQFSLKNSLMKEWDGISIRALNNSKGLDMGHTHSAYITTSQSGSTCKVITSPETPPPAQMHVKVDAPSIWDLGELQQGSNTVAPRQQLCFSYSNSDAYGRRLLLDAQASNGTAQSLYWLVNSQHPNQKIPYTLMLETLDFDGEADRQVSLPNTSRQGVRFSNAKGRTCFTPSFVANVDRQATGDYTDTLNFTLTIMP